MLKNQLKKLIANQKETKLT